MRTKLRAAGAMATGILAAAIFLSCSAAKPSTVVVYTSVDQVFAEPVFRQFEKETGIKVRAVFDTEETKSTGVLNRLIAEASNPQADVFWSGDSVRPFLLMQRGLVQPYRSAQALNIPAAMAIARRLLDRGRRSLPGAAGKHREVGKSTPAPIGA